MILNETNEIFFQIFGIILKLFLSLNPNSHFSDYNRQDNKNWLIVFFHIAITKSIFYSWKISCDLKNLNYFFCLVEKLILWESYEAPKSGWVFGRSELIERVVYTIIQVKNIEENSIILTKKEKTYSQSNSFMC